MLDNKKIACFISEKRRQLGLTQQQIADKLNVSFQAVSKWENGSTYPNTELLRELSALLGVTIDELLDGREKGKERLTYSKAGIDNIYTDAIKTEISKYLVSEDKRVLNGLGPFASLYDIKFDNIKNPVLVLKSEEPGSKQKLAVKYGYTESICHDMINHLVNDIIVMGARPLAVLDTILCGNAEKDTIKTIVKGISDACRDNECSLIGGKIAIQPNVVETGVYILTSSIAGIAERDNIIDGSKISKGDRLLAVASNGLHTNGYSLVRMMMEQFPKIINEKVDGESFIDCIMKPHTPYYRALRNILPDKCVKGLAHITGGGIEGNLCRIIPDGLCAEIDLSRLKTLPIFKYIKSVGGISDEEMLNTFNCGTGLIIVADNAGRDSIIKHVSKYHDCYEIGEIIESKAKSNIDMHGRFCNIWQSFL